MKLIYILALSLPLLILPGYADASLLSPGKLSKAHAKYEGIKKCTLCHKLGGGVLDSKCLDCHKKLDKRIKKKEGVHSRFTDKCIVCHSDHLGRDHPLISLDEKEFDHDLTDYPLKGSHTDLLCSKCHKRQAVYTGLVQECISCHEDEHSGQLGKRCEECHVPDDWKKLAAFDHSNNSKFKLTGRHAKAECVKCHPRGRYKGLKSKGCATVDCHGDKHRGQFKKKLCTDCHNTNASTWKVRAKFDHGLDSKFTLTGAHAKAECVKCHPKGRYKGLKSKGCATADCHTKEHKEQFGKKVCTDCHLDDASTWKVRRKFSHSRDSSYTLTGAHTRVECAKCHVNGLYKPITHDSCGTSGCHGDFHKGQFDKKSCTECHNDRALSWWVGAKFDHGRDSEFKLNGRHTRVECSKCHPKGRYKGLDSRNCSTADCHNDRHTGQFEEKRCTECHHDTAVSWSVSNVFDHKRDSDFKLTGLHATVRCNKCHRAGRYKPIKKGCYECHRKGDPHKRKLGRECEKCHTAKGWKKHTFDHEKDTSFTLIPKHEGLKCSDCHVSKTYSKISRDCQSCHKK